MSKQLIPILEIAIKESLKNYEAREDRNSLGDLYLFHDTEDNLLVVYDDTDQVLNKVQLPDERFFNLAHTLRQVLQQAGKEKLFDRSYIEKPFTVSLIDKDFVVLEELFFLDDNTIKIDDVLWTNIEKDLDTFLEHLLQ
ncbi:MAG: hypothetical protein FWF53_04995 [Candidatus Azobacteroides sp.]|nr:hypothetical protein [Candidatus Azobacteroides sp.]